MIFSINVWELKQAQVSSSNMNHWWPAPLHGAQARRGSGEVRKTKQAWNLSSLSVYPCGSLGTKSWKERPPKNPWTRGRNCLGLVSGLRSCSLWPEVITTHCGYLFQGRPRLPKLRRVMNKTTNSQWQIIVARTWFPRPDLISLESSTASSQSKASLGSWAFIRSLLIGNGVTSMRNPQTK